MTFVKTKDQFETWSWLDQDTWCCTCVSGNAQSPINLESDTALNRPNNKIRLRYKPIEDVYLVYNGREMEVNFGNEIVIRKIWRLRLQE